MKTGPVFPSLRPSFNGVPLNMSSVIEMVMMSVAGLILLVGKADVHVAMQGNVFASGMNAMVSIFGVAWMGSTRIGKYVINHSFQLSGFITTFVSIAVGYLIVTFLY